MSQSIPNSLLPHLNEIAARLWSGHAAIMVGSGFSKNATPISDSCKSFPDWNQLGELFYEKSRGERIIDGRFLNVLKLADEVQASLGRPMLHQMLRDSIPDDEYEPSNLHTSLLNLPWSDVLTTNYDTLLERAARSVTEYNYQLVVNSQNLIYSEQPRIIKLHGSFPSIEPFIITEEDYRRYPKDFAPFVNTVQQSLLENTLCLIGFSGDDPNFLRWIGWIRDNLGEEKSPKIYLIGVLNLTQAQISLLAKYNIVPIDMSDLDDIGEHDHYKGIERFFEFCSSKKSESDKLDWPTCDFYMSPDSSRDKTTKQQIEEVLPLWKNHRESFPGWVVVPEDRRKKLWTYTNHWEGIIKSVDELPVELLLNFLYEYFWRIEKCLCPIFDPNVELIEFVLNHGVRFVNNARDDSNNGARDVKFTGLSLNQVKEQCCFLQLTYLRYLREEGKFKDWKLNDKRALSFLNQSADYSRYHYEKCLYSLFEFDIEELENRLQQWAIKQNQPLWIAKKAGLLAEMGKTDEAATLLEGALKTVRSRLNLRPITSDYSDVSQESYILFLLLHVKSSLAWTAKDYQTMPKFSDRWNILKQYKCDPWNELKLLEQTLKRGYKKAPKSLNTPHFDLGRSNNITSFGNTNNDYLDAFRLFKFAEEIGTPFRLP
ncbi:MAG: SIR2 family protein [Oceanospirillaceae bacterium]